MADISQITLPSGSTYDIKDATARSQIADIAAAGLTYTVVQTLPTASASTKGSIYLVPDAQSTNNDYDEYITITTDNGTTYQWEKIGSTEMDLSNYVTGVTLNKLTDTVLGGANQTTTYISGSASGGAVAWNSKDQVTALTGLGTPSTANVVGTGATFSVTDPSITISANATTGTGNLYVESISVTSSNKLVTTSLKGVSGTETVSKVTEATSQTTADGTWTASSSNSDLLANISVSGEVLSIGAATLDTQTTTQFTASDKTVAKANASATTVATGSITSSGTGSAVVTAVTPTSKRMRATASGTAVAFDSTDTKSAVTGYASPSSDTVIGSDATFTVTQPTISLENNGNATSGRAQAVKEISFTNATPLSTGTSITVTKGNS